MHDGLWPGPLPVHGFLQVRVGAHAADLRDFHRAGSNRLAPKAVTDEIPRYLTIMRMSQVEKKSGHLALLRLGKRNQSLLNFFNAHGERILGQ